MCLGIPGKIVEVNRSGDVPMGKVEFGGILKDVCLAYAPEAGVDDYVLVHVGFAISVIDEAEATETMNYVREIEAEMANMAGWDPAEQPPDAPPNNSPPEHPPRNP